MSPEVRERLVYIWVEIAAWYRTVVIVLAGCTVCLYAAVVIYERTIFETPDWLSGLWQWLTDRWQWGVVLAASAVAALLFEAIAGKSQQRSLQ